MHNKKKRNKNGDSSFLQVLHFIILTVSWLILLKIKRLGKQGIQELIDRTPASASSLALLLSLGGRPGFAFQVGNNVLE